jgi:hypothetical protein
MNPTHDTIFGFENHQVLVDITTIQDDIPVQVPDEPISQETIDELERLAGDKRARDGRIIRFTSNTTTTRDWTKTSAERNTSGWSLQRLDTIAIIDASEESITERFYRECAEDLQDEIDRLPGRHRALALIKLHLEREAADPDGEISPLKFYLDWADREGVGRPIAKRRQDGRVVRFPAGTVNAGHPIIRHDLPTFKLEWYAEAKRYREDLRWRLWAEREMV